MGAVIAAAALLATLQACSSIPDAVNPVAWYKGAGDWLSGDDTSAKAKKAEADAPDIPGQDRPYPKVSSVPEAPRRSTKEERSKAAQSLIADREHARYTDEVIRRQSASIAPSTTPTAAPKTATPARAPAPRVEPPPPRAAAPAARPSPSPTSRAASAVPPPAPMRAEAVPPPFPAARPVAPPRPNLARRPPPPPPPPVATASPAVAPAIAPPPQFVFGPPPSDIAILQDRRSGPARAAPGSTLSIESLLPSRGVRQSPAPNPAIPSAPDPASLDPASQVAIVTFGQGSSKLSGTARRIIREVAEMQRQRGGTLHVIGHASSWTRDMNPVRHNMINFGLSIDRANSVAHELLRLGVTTSQFSIGAMSDGRPLFFEVMPSGEAANRRVEIFLDGG